MIVNSSNIQNLTFRYHLPNIDVFSNLVWPAIVKVCE